ncbi:transmembrane protein 9B-like [Rhopilema esculentum]|uniref:transmembrane protein 9B-like n=1 Tax=Rhopilema esculentum TaxID=499914 RepID=UPI0031DA918A|eukprot:gene5211-349_t
MGLATERIFLFALALSGFTFFAEAQYDDVRCKCVCPKEIGTNKTNVHIKTVEADQCKCEHIVQREEKFCLRCQCSYEARNTLLIKIIIILVLVSIAVLFIYMGCLMLVSRNRTLSVVSDERQEELKNRPKFRRSTSLTMQGIDKKMDEWRTKLSAQRENVYRTRTMLN